MYLYTLKQLCNLTGYNHHVVNRFKKNVSLHVETTNRWSKLWCKVLWIALKKMYLYTLKQPLFFSVRASSVVNRFKKNVSLHVETTTSDNTGIEAMLWIALKKMYLYTLKQQYKKAPRHWFVVNRFKKNVSLHVETTLHL